MHSLPLLELNAVNLRIITDLVRNYHFVLSQFVSKYIIVNDYVMQCYHAHLPKESRPKFGDRTAAFKQKYTTVTTIGTVAF